MKTLTAAQAELLRTMKMARQRNANYLADPTKGKGVAALTAVARTRTLLADLRR